MSDDKLRQDRPYRRGLVLGLTMAEIMILVVFALLLTLTASIASRDNEVASLLSRNRQLEQVSRLVEMINARRPSGGSFDDAFKEIVAAQDFVDQMKANRVVDVETTLADAANGWALREFADAYGIESEAELTSNLLGMAREVYRATGGVSNPSELARSAELGELLRRHARNAGVFDPREYLRALIDEVRRCRSANNQTDTTSLSADAALGHLVRELADARNRKEAETFAREAALAWDLVQEAASDSGVLDRILEDASLGRALRAASEASGAEDPLEFLNVLNEEGANEPGGWPPYIGLSEADGYYFESGSAVLRPEFEQALVSQTVPMLLALAKRYDVDVIEVVGHTDEVPMRGSTNLDDNLIAASVGEVPIVSLGFSDNAGLGMARAVSVASVLKADSRLAGITILPLSGAQMIIPIDTPATGLEGGDQPYRRRIEIRLRRSTTEALLQENE